MTQLDRRRFLQMAGSASFLSAIDGRLGWAAAQPRKAQFAYIGSEHAIHVHSISEHGPLLELQTVSSARPVAMAISHGKLYVANGVSEFGNLPRGSVEAYAIDAATGRLAWINRVPLSLSGVGPRALAVHPNGRSVVVAIHGGGAYNLLNLEEDGRLGGVTAILKEIGSGPHPLQASAHPSAVIFGREGQVLTADEGVDKLSVLAVNDGELTVSARCEVAAGSGPGCMVIHPEGRRVYVAHAFDGSVSGFNYEPAGHLSRRQTLWASSKSEVASLAMHPSGEALYSSHGRELQTWKVTANGDLQALHATEGIQAHTLHIAADGENLWALSSDAVLRMDIDGATGIPSAPEKLASLSNLLSIAIA
jgi:6-phosphogluconolactonase